MKKKKSGRFAAKKKGGVWKKVILITLLVILLLILGTVGAAYGYYHSKVSQLVADETIPPEDMGLTQEQEVELAEKGEELAQEMEDITSLLEKVEPIESTKEVMEDDKILNILLIGTDERTNGFSDFARGDSCMLFSVNTSGDAPVVSLVSFERGMGVPILSGMYEGQWDWLTHTFAYGGAELMMQEIRHCFKVEVDYYVRVNFSSFTQGIDALGGVDVDLSAAEVQYFRGKGYDVHQGITHMDGQMALTYARLRSIDSDWRRIERQRKIIAAALQQLTTKSLSEIDQLIDDVLPLVRTNVPEEVITEMLLLAPSLPKVTVQQMTIPQEGTYGSMMGMNDRSLFSVDFETNTQILHDFLNGVYESPEEDTQTTRPQGNAHVTGSVSTVEPETSEPGETQEDETQPESTQ